jgi:hypothetical protein
MTFLRRGHSHFLGFKSAALAAAGCVLAFAAVAQNVPRDAQGFSDFVATQLRSQLNDAEIVVKGPLTLGVGDLQVNLDRIFTFCQRNSGGCLAQIDNYVGGAAASRSEARRTNPTGSALPSSKLPWSSRTFQPELAM